MSDYSYENGSGRPYKVVVYLCNEMSATLEVMDERWEATEPEIWDYARRLASEADGGNADLSRVAIGVAPLLEVVGRDYWRVGEPAFRNYNGDAITSRSLYGERDGYPLPDSAEFARVSASAGGVS